MKRHQIQEIVLRNYRCFRTQQTARLTPLTLLVGDNSTGKTSFLAAVRAVLDIAHRHQAPDFRAPPYDLGGFSEIAHNQGGTKGENSFSIGLQRDDEPHAVRFEARFELGTDAAPSLSCVSWDNDAAWIRCNYSSAKVEFEFGTSSGSWGLDVPRSHDTRATGMTGMFLLFGIISAIQRSDGLSDLKILHGSENLPKQRDIEQFGYLLEGFSPFDSMQVFASAPIQSGPLRTYDPIMLSRDPKGADVPAYLASLRFRDQERWHTIKTRMETFGDTSGLFDEISVRHLTGSEGGPFQLEIRKYGSRGRKGTKRNLVDVGYGVSQILPVLAEVFRPDGSQTLLLQQPEIHLHPSAQAALGGLFCATAAAGRQLFVETHSEYIVDRVRMDIRDRTTDLKPDEVSLLFFERSNLEVRIHSLRFDEQGNVLNAPDGYGQFFMNEMRRSIGL